MAIAEADATVDGAVDESDCVVPVVEGVVPPVDEVELSTFGPDDEPEADEEDVERGEENRGEEDEEGDEVNEFEPLMNEVDPSTTEDIPPIT